MFESDRIVNTMYHEPCYNIAWVTTTKDGKPYVLVPCQKGKERDCLDELLIILNRSWSGSTEEKAA